MAQLEFNAIRKWYQQTKVIHRFDMHIQDGEFIVVVGPSGCGKSTLLRMVAGLEAITEGELSLDGKVINTLTPKNRDIAMVFQNYALYPHMTVFDNMAYGLKMRKHRQDVIQSRVIQAAKMLELDALLKRKPRELSGGQRQRVAMGRAIVRKPKLFLFDEPLSNLDAKLRVQMRLQIKKLQQELGITSLYVTHDQVEAMTMADRLVVLNKGRAEQIGTALEIYEKPATVFVAGFIGSPAMNFFQASISADKRYVQLNEQIRFQLASTQIGSISADQPVTLGIRPEHITHNLDKAVDQFELTISHTETLGANTLVYGYLAANTQLITVRLPGRERPLPGETMVLGLKRNSLHLFDQASQKRIMES